MKRITLDLKVDEANLVLEGLANLPFIKVHELIAKIHQQASTQVVDIKTGTESFNEQPDSVIAG